MFIKRKREKRILLSQNEKLQLLFQASIMLCQKISVIQVLEILTQSVRSKKIVTICKNIQIYLHQGYSITESIEAILKPPPFFIAILSSGEKTGHLGEYLLESYTFSKNNAEIKNQQKAQTFYPLFIFSATFLLSIAILAFAIPSMKSMAESIGLTLPRSTVSMINFFSWLGTHWMYIVPSLLGGIFLLVYNIRKYRYFFEWLSLKLPYFGSFIRKKELFSALTLFAMLLRDKIPVEKALLYSIESVQKKPFQDELSFAVEEINTGKMEFAQLYKKFGKDLYMLSFLKSSVNSTQLIENVHFIAHLLSQEIEDRRKRFIKLIEPLSLGVIGLMVLLVITKVYLPFFEMFNTMDWMSGF